jgi:zinc transport system permease protein
MEDFIIRAILAAVGISIITGSLGCLVVWKRMSYFSESISHSSLLGLTLGIASGLGINFGLILIGVLFSLLVMILQERKSLSSDATLGILSHITLALGIVILPLVGNTNIDYFSILFGNILSINNKDIIWIYLIVLVISTLLYFFWQKFLLLTINEELAKAEGMNHIFYKILFTFMLTLTVYISVQTIGVLLITSLLIIPPTIARVFSDKPNKMAFQSILVSILSAIVGIIISMYYDIAAAPSIVITLGVLFVFSQLIKSK